MTRKVMLMILDGWGYRKSDSWNAVQKAKTPNFDRLWKMSPHMTLYAAQQHVGLPKGFMGNSEVGHTHLGAGRLISQELVKLNKAIRNGSFFKNKELLEAMIHVKRNRSTLHLMGLLSDGGVHSHINHLFALLKMAKVSKIDNVCVHCFLDGRDTPPQSALKYINQLEKEFRKLGIGRIASIIGRYYAMDRDNRWNREHKAYDTLVNATGFRYASAHHALKAAYERRETDEFVKPSLILSPGEGIGKVSAGDSIIFYNFREDRARELTRAFVQGKFKNFRRRKVLDIHFVCLTQYDRKINARVAFPPKIPESVLGEVISKAGLRQFRLAETEKYAHVTYFFNGGREGPFPREDRVVIPSPKIATYDKKPEMSALKIKKEAVKQLKSEKYDFIVMNFANADMVGHTGNFYATVQALQDVDLCIGEIVNAALNNEYDIIITADHGNAEEMSGKHKTSHTLNKVPFIIVSEKKYLLNNFLGASIANVAPTVLKMMGLKAPKIYGKSLLK